MDYFIQQLVNGLAAGSVYALICVGYSMVFGMLEMINFAHGDVYMFGTFLAFAMLSGGVPTWIALLGSLLCGAATGIIVERVAYKPVRGAHRIVPMISAVGAALVLRNVAQIIWGTRTYPFPAIIPQKVFQVGNVRFSTLQLSILMIGVALMVVFSVALNRTKVGRAVRLVAQNIPVSRLMGIPVDRTISLVYGVGAALGVAGGILFSSYYSSVFIGMGFLGTLKAWTAAIIGGIGNIYGAFLGGMLLGVTEAFISGYVSSAYKDAISFALVILILVLKPSGLLGAQIAEKV